MTAALEGVSGQQHAPAELHLRERARTPFTGGWVGPRAGLDGRKISIPDRPARSLLYNEYRVFPGGKERPGRDVEPSPPSSAVVKKK